MMKRKSLKVAFMGFGMMASKFHAKFIADNCSDYIEIVAIGDVLENDKLGVERKVENLNIRPKLYFIKPKLAADVTNIECIDKIVNDFPNLDAVVISTPHAKHFYQIKRFLELGIHVLVDKPLALTYSDGKFLVDLAKEKMLTLVVSSQRRYEVVYDYAKQVIVNNELGEIITVDSVISHAHDWVHSWRTKAVLAGGGALWSLGWHTIDTVVYLLDKKIKSVAASIYYPDSDGLDTHANALLCFENNTSVTLTANHLAPKGAVFERLQIGGTKAMVTLDRFKPRYDTEQPKVTHQDWHGRLIVPCLLYTSPSPRDS